MYSIRLYLYLAGAVVLFALLIKFLLQRRKKKNDDSPYSDAKLELFEKHLSDHFGPHNNVFHEVLPVDDMHIDIYVVLPTKAHPYYRLFTCGMGAKRMLLPKEARGVCPDRIELMMTLPADWQINQESMEDLNNSWPVLLLQLLARFPWKESTWLGCGHTIPFEKFAENTDFSCVVLNYPKNYSFAAERLRFPTGEMVQFVQVIPIYEEEMYYAVDYGMEQFEREMEDVLQAPVDIHRKNRCK